MITISDDDDGDNKKIRMMKMMMMMIIIIMTTTALHEAQIRLTYFVYKDTTTELAAVCTAVQSVHPAKMYRYLL